jgi:hypothetical protein
MTISRFGSLISLSIAVAAAASGGATNAPRVTATAHGMAGSIHRATNATAPVVTLTATRISEATGNQFLRRSRIGLSKAASSSTGATNRASARSGSRVRRGPLGSSARTMPPKASSAGDGMASRRARDANSTAPSSSANTHSSVIICRFDSKCHQRDTGVSHMRRKAELR